MLKNNYSIEVSEKTNWINIAKDNYYDHLSKLDKDSVSTKWSTDKKTCTYSLDGVSYIQKTDYFKNRVYYNLNI